MAKERKPVLIPFDTDGSIPHYIEYDGSLWDWRTQTRRDVKMRPAEAFNAILQLECLESGRSKVNAVWRNVLTGATYRMTQMQFNSLIKTAEWQGPLLVDGLWRPVKRGENYLIEYVPPEKA